MGRRATGGMHVDRVRSRHTSKSGETREYESRLLRRSFRKPDGKVGKETLANLSMLPAAAVDAIEAVLKGRTLVDAGAALAVTRSRAHGHVALVDAAARQLGFPALLGPPCRERDLSSSWVEGTHCQLAARGYSRDGKKGREQIEYGLLTDPEGRPVAIRVFPGNTADPAAFTEAVETVRGKFGLDDLVMVGDRGMITSARIRALKELGGMSWITCLCAPAIKKLMAGDGPLQLSLFDQQDLAEITHPDYPGERLIACRNPLLAAQRARKREDLLTATEAL